MADPESNLKVERYLLKNSVEIKDWAQVNSFCEAYSSVLTDKEYALWIRSKYILEDYSACHELCLPDERDLNNSLLFEKCRFRLRAALRLDDSILTTEAVELFMENFPSEVEPKQAKMQLKYSQGDFSMSLDLSEEILEIDPSNLISIRFRARSLTRTSYDQTAVRDAWNSILFMEPDNLEAINGIARSHIEESNFLDARKILKTLLDIEPNYGPGLTTLANLDSMTDGDDYDQIQDIEMNYKVMYSKGRYTELIHSLGGLSSRENWSEGELIFVFRALSRQKRFSDIIALYNSDIELHSDLPQVMEEVAVAARELGKRGVYEQVMENLSNLSKTNEDGMKYYLRNLIYFDSDSSFISSEIDKLLSIHGNGSLPRIITYILKSSKYEILEKSEFGGNIRSLLDPIRGTLIEKIGSVEYTSIWNELSHKFYHALSYSDSKSIPKPMSKITTGVENYPSSKSMAIPTLNEDIESRASFSLYDFHPYAHHQMDQEDLVDSLKSIGNIDEICDLVQTQSHYFEPFLANDDLVVVCSNSIIPKGFSDKGKAIRRISFEVIDTQLAVREFNISERGEELVLESVIIEDPRHTIGRFFSLLRDLGRTNLMIIAILARSINEKYPSEVWYTSTCPQGKIAATILGYPEERILSVR